MHRYKYFLESLNKKGILSHRFIVITLIFTGVTIRLFFYIKNPALWLDEATLSLNIINRDYTDLLKPLDTLQIAPIGFLLIEKFLTNIFGTSEYILRLFPFLAGISSIPLFYLLAKKLTNKHIAVIALTFFIFGRSLIYYSLEVKQYSLDVFVFIVCLLVFQPKEKFNQSYITSTIYGLSGAIIIWFSHIAIIVLTAIGLWTFFLIIKEKAWQKIPPFLLLTGLWIGSFAINYFLFLSGHSHESFQQSAFASFEFFPPFPITADNLIWYKDFLTGLFVFPLEIKPCLLAIILSFIGVIIIIWKKQYILLSLFIPLIINFILSIFHIYPCKDRLILYNASATILLLAYSIYNIFNRLPYHYLLIIPLLFAFLLNPIRLVINGFPKEEIRKPMQFISDNYQKDDLLYVQYGSRWAYEYYEDRYIPDNMEIIVGKWIRSDPDLFNETFKNFINRDRVWLLFSHYTDSEKEVIISKCEEYGKLIEKYEIQRSGAYLYSFK